MMLSVSQQGVAPHHWLQLQCLQVAKYMIYIWLDYILVNGFIIIIEH